jgi:hypothetical protein
VWTIVTEHASPLFENWTPANWIAFGTGAGSFLLGVRNARRTAKGEREKNKREEFHRRVAMPIEGALELFRSVTEELHDAHDASGKIADIDALLKRARAAQRRLSQTLRLAGNSPHCSDTGWDVGNDEYDRFVGAIDQLRTVPDDQYAAVLLTAIAALSQQNAVVVAKIDNELSRYTIGRHWWQRNEKTRKPS